MNPQQQAGATTPPTTPPATPAQPTPPPNNPFLEALGLKPKVQQPAAPVAPAPTPVPAPAPVAPAADPAGARYAAVVKKDLEATAKLQEAKALSAQNTKWADAEKLAKDNPIAFLEKFGISYDSLTQRILNDGKPTVENKLETVQERLDRLENEQKESQVRAAQGSYDRAVEQFRGDIAKQVATKPEAFELLILEGRDGVETVEEVIRVHHKRTGELLEIDVAAEMVESHLLETYRKKLTAKKLQPGTPPAPPVAAAPAAPATAPRPPANPGQQTLREDLAPQTPAPEPGRVLTDEEIVKRAASRLKWK